MVKWRGVWCFGVSYNIRHVRLSPGFVLVSIIALSYIPFTHRPGTALWWHGLYLYEVEGAGEL